MRLLRNPFIDHAPRYGINTPVICCWENADTAGVEASSINVTVPSSSSTNGDDPRDVAEGDLLLIFVGCDDLDNNSPNWDNTTYKPAGFTLLYEWGNSFVDSHGALFAKIADGTESGTTINVPKETAVAGIDELYASCILIKNHSGSISDIVVGTHNGDGTPPLYGNTITTTVDNSLALTFATYDGGQAGSFWWTTPWIKRQDLFSGTGTEDACGTWGSCIVPHAGTSPQHEIMPEGTSDGMMAVTFAIAPPTVSLVAGDVTDSGEGVTLQSSWDISHPAYSNGDLLIVNVSSNGTPTHTFPSTGPNGETIHTIIANHIAAGATDPVASAFYWIGSGSASAGTITVTPSAAERWTAAVLKVASGNYNHSSPIDSVVGTGGDPSGTATAAPSPAWTPASGTGGAVVSWLAIDNDPASTPPSGWTNLSSVDRNTVTGCLAVRTEKATSGMPVASADWAIAGDNSSTIGYVIKPPAVYSTGGTLSVNDQAAPSTVDLTSTGSTDWVHWGLATSTDVNRKSGVAARIGALTNVGGTMLRYAPPGGARVQWSWTDGTPTASGSTNAGLYLEGVGNRFELSVAANPNLGSFTIYAGGWKAKGRLDIALSDGSAAPLSVIIDNPSGTIDRKVDISFASASPGQSLRIDYTLLDNYGVGGNITIGAADLVFDITGTLSISSADSQSQAVNLTSQGSIDWAKWGRSVVTDFDHKSGVTQRISDYSELPGSTTTGRAAGTGNDVSYTWTDGTPTASATNNTAFVYWNTLNHGWSFTVDCDQTERNLKVYVSGYSTIQRVTASLSDASAPDVYIDLDTGSATNKYWEITIPHKAGTEGQQLTVTGQYTTLYSGGDIDLSGATLGPAGSTGSMATQETGSDTFAASGTVPISGTLSVQESGSDTAAASGTVAVAGTLTVQETGSDTLAATGTVAVSGTLVVQETGSDTAAASGTVAVAGTLSVQEAGADTFAASGTVAVSGTLSVQETGSDTASMTGTVAVAGTLVVQETGSDTFAATGTVSAGGSPVTGSLVAQESGSDTFAASGTVAIAGSMASQESGSDTAAMTGAVAVAGSMAVQETGTDTFAATGSVPATGSLSVQETGTDTAAGTGLVLIAGGLSVQETGSDTASATGGVAVTGTMAVQEAANDTFAGAGTVAVAGTMAAQETGADLVIMHGYIGDPPVVKVTPVARFALINGV